MRRPSAGARPKFCWRRALHGKRGIHASQAISASQDHGEFARIHQPTDNSHASSVLLQRKLRSPLSETTASGAKNGDAHLLARWSGTTAGRSQRHYCHTPRPDAARCLTGAIQRAQLRLQLLETTLDPSLDGHGGNSKTGSDVAQTATFEDDGLHGLPFRWLQLGERLLNDGSAFSIEHH